MIGFEDEVKETSMAAAGGGGEDELEPEEDVFSSLAPESPEEILAQVGAHPKCYRVYANRTQAKKKLL